jgi:hypothetical protein
MVHWLLMNGTISSSFSYIKKLFARTGSARVTNVLLLGGIVFVIWSFAFASTPDPGHPWLQVGDGLWAATGTTAYHTFTFPDASATVMTTLGVSQGDIIYGSAASTTASLAKDTNATRYLSNTGASNNPAWALVNLADGVTGLLGLTNGGTGASLSPSNGGIVYSTASVLAVLAGTATAGKVLMSGTSSAPTWSTAVYPDTAGAAGNILASNGTNWISSSTPVVATTTTIATRAPAATGGFTATSMASQTIYKVGLFPVPFGIIVNQISLSISAVTTAGTMKQCIYDINGALVISATGTPAGAGTTMSTTVSPAVYLKPGNYYYAVGCAASCSDTPNYWTTTTASPLTTLTPAGKKIYEGTATMSAGICAATLPTISAVISSTPVGRLDN